jgi:hypothetical protein
MEEELPKIKKLIPKGASQYVLLTNIPGTAHPEVGAIDLLSTMLGSSLEIPAICWWRDDINRRLDCAWSLKWAYPELMTGQDLLRAIIEAGLSEHRERRSATLRAFLRHQYDQDEQVRFKQVELQNRLLDLFIDVPINLGDKQATRRVALTFHYVAETLALDLHANDQVESAVNTNADEMMHWQPSQEDGIGAATFLLCKSLQTHMPHVVLEGAPGQGKSTITQYLCQVHCRHGLFPHLFVAQFAVPVLAA